jgi:gliding motility-associated-like protein
VQVYLQPVIDAGPSFTVKEGTTIQFKATANSTNLQFVWTPGQELSNPNILQPSLRVMNDGVYKLTATGDHNCTATDELKVVVQRPVETPNVFSPNGDGINDTWMIKNLILYPNSLLEVFNRYGQLVFRSKGYTTPWDGKMNGKPVPVGTYYYVIQLGNGDPAIKGSVTILR